MALDTFIAGRYSNTYNGTDTGITEQGYELQVEFGSEDIAESDAYGTSLIDWVYRGGKTYLQSESLAYKAGSITPFFPWNGTVGRMGIVGRLASDVALATVLTATAGTPAAATPATLTASKSLLAPNNPARLLFNSKLRKVPIRLALLPYDSGGNIIWFSTTVLLIGTMLSLLFGGGPVA
jgi:hypothetical protein